MPKLQVFISTKAMEKLREYKALEKHPNLDEATDAFILEKSS
jgi:hypothetical protein